MNPLTQRDIILSKAGLDYLHSLDGGQAIELEIHAAILRDPSVHPKPSASEVETVLKMKWSISDAGEAARIEMGT